MSSTRSTKFLLAARHGGRALRRLCSTGAFLRLSLVVLFCTVALGGKPPPQPPVDSGVIYYQIGTASWSMLPDGSSKTNFSNALPGTLLPSKHLHGGARWFLTEMAVNPGVETYGDGRQRMEVFAVNAAGAAVQLTADPTLQPNAIWMAVGDTEVASIFFLHARWAVDDTRVSYLARRWGTDLKGQPAVVEMGIYAVDLDDDVSALATPVVPYRVPVELPVNQHETYGIWPDARGYSWSPDGTKIAYTPCDLGLLVADSQTGESTLLVSAIDCQIELPEWSPAGDKILFHSGGPVSSGGSIETISPDGIGGRVAIVTGSNERGSGKPVDARWSPNATHVCYSRYTMGWNKEKALIYRCTSSGSSEAAITNVNEGQSWASAWVAAE